MTKNNTDNQELNHYINNFRTLKKANSKNIFNLFIESDIRIGSNYSISSMIVPEGLFETRSYTETTNLLKENGSLLNITRIEGMVFDEANTGNVIFIFGKNIIEDSLKERIFKKNQDLINYDVKVDPIISKIDHSNVSRLSDFCQIFKGMVVSERKNNIFKDKTEKLHDKFLLGNCISKWNIERYYYTNYDKLKIIGGTKVKYKYEIAPRILIRRTGDYLCCAYLTEPALTESTIYSCWSIDKNIHNLFILGVLHSKVADYYIKNKLITNPQAFPQILMTDLKLLPIPYPDMENHNLIKNLTEKGLKFNEINNYATNLENEIDQIVYKLYGLTEDEIKIVESA